MAELAEVPAVVLSCFDRSTRLLPFVLYDSHIFPSGARTIAAALYQAGLTRTRAVFQLWNPHFRPSHVVLDPDGNLLVSDWYGRDDESDKTGRIWRVRYTGKDRPAVEHRLDAKEWDRDEYALSALGSPAHLVREKAADVLVLEPSLAGGVSLPALLEALGKREVQDVLVEGGPTLAWSFVEAGLVDRVVLFLAPALLGGADAPSVLGGEGFAPVGAGLRLRIVNVRRVGEDLEVEADVHRDR